jgi:hypothetical protein
MSNPNSRFSLPHLRALHNQLQINKNVNDGNVDAMVEALREIAEMVVYGDNKSEMLFDFFCEKNMLSLFLEIMWQEGGCPQSVLLQILQTLSILVNCVRNDTSLYYLLSNNYINEIIIYPYDFSEDENLVDQFVSFMKSLSLRLDYKTVQFFFSQEDEENAFPLLTRATELLTHEEAMVRIASQTIILNVFRVDDTRSREHALHDDVLNKMFKCMANFCVEKTAFICLQRRRYEALYQQWLLQCAPAGAQQGGDKKNGQDTGGEGETQIQKNTWRESDPGSSSSSSSSGIKGRESNDDANGNSSSNSDSDNGGNMDLETLRREMKSSQNQLSDAVNSVEDWFYFLKDFLDLGVFHLEYRLVGYLCDHWVLPQLLARVCFTVTATSTEQGGAAVTNTDDDLAEAEVALLVLGMLLSTVNNSLLHRAVLTALFHPLNGEARIAAVRANADSSSAPQADSIAEHEAAAAGSTVNKAYTLLRTLCSSSSNGPSLAGSSKERMQALFSAVLAAALGSVLQRGRELASATEGDLPRRQTDSYLHFAYNTYTLAAIGVLPFPHADNEQGEEQEQEQEPCGCSTFHFYGTCSHSQAAYLALGAGSKAPSQKSTPASSPTKAKPSPGVHNSSKGDEGDGEDGEEGEVSRRARTESELAELEQDRALQVKRRTLNAKHVPVLDRIHCIGDACAADLLSFLAVDDGHINAGTNASNAATSSSASGRARLSREQLLSSVLSVPSQDYRWHPYMVATSALAAVAGSNSGVDNSSTAQALLQAFCEGEAASGAFSPFLAITTLQTAWMHVQTLHKAFLSARDLTLAADCKREGHEAGEGVGNEEGGEEEQEQRALREAVAAGLPAAQSRLLADLARIGGVAESAYASAADALLGSCKDIPADKSSSSSSSSSSNTHSAQDLLRIVQSELLRLSSLQVGGSGSLQTMLPRLFSSVDLYLPPASPGVVRRLGLSYCRVEESNAKNGSGGDSNNISNDSTTQRPPREEILRRRTMGLLMLRVFLQRVRLVALSVQGQSQGLDSSDLGGAWTGDGASEGELFAAPLSSTDPALWAISEGSLWDQHFEQRKLVERSRSRSSTGTGGNNGSSSSSDRGASRDSGGSGRGERRVSAPDTHISSNSSSSSLSSRGSDGGGSPSHPVAAAEPLRAGDLLRMKGRKFLEAKSTATIATKAIATPQRTPSSGGSGSNSTPGSEFSFSRFFGFGSGGKDRDNGSLPNTPHSTNSSRSNRTPVATPPRALGGGSASSLAASGGVSTGGASKQQEVTTNVLFVQSKHSLVVVESTPKSIADDCYCVLGAAPLACTTAVLDQEDPRKMKITVTATGPNSSSSNSSNRSNSVCVFASVSSRAVSQGRELGYMREEGVAPADAESELMRLTAELAVAAGESNATTAIAASSSRLDTITVADGGYSPQEAPSLYPAPLLQQKWTSYMSFSSEKVCRLARDHITGRGRDARASQQGMYLALLKEAVAAGGK